MKMMWAPLGFFSGNIYNCIFSDKKNQIQKIGPHGFLWPEGVDKSLRFCSWQGLSHLINFEENVLDA